MQASYGPQYFSVTVTCVHSRHWAQLGRSGVSERFNACFCTGSKAKKVKGTMPEKMELN